MTLPEIAGHELQDLIGSGSCGAVYRGRTADGQTCAVKVFSSMAINRQALAAAIHALQVMPPHPGVLRPLSWGMDRSPYFCAMPLLGQVVQDGHGRQRWEASTLEDRCLLGVTTEVAWQLIYELADALAWLHKHGVTHGNLRPCNILCTESSEGSVRLTDVAQGWVGGIHHLDLGDHFVYLCPEQAENPAALFSLRGMGWDVYSFGVIAYRLLTGRLPRAHDQWEQQLQGAQRQVAAGLAYQIDGPHLIRSVLAQTEVSWPAPAASPWEERRRKIIDRALHLDPAQRWVDMRDVLREFERLEADYQLQESQAQTVAERERQANQVRSLRQKTTALAAALALLAGLGGYTWWRAAAAEKALAASDQLHQADIAARETAAAGLLAERDSQIDHLTQERETLHKAKSVADTNLKHAQSAVDRFLTQLLQTPTSNELEVEFSKAQLEEARDFVMQSLTPLESRPELAIERARAYGNIGQIHLKLRDEEQAGVYLEKARAETAKLLESPTDATRLPQFQQWLGRYDLLLADWHRHRGEMTQAYQLLQEATSNLQEGLASDPKNRLARAQCARACLELGNQAFERGDLAAASAALTRATQVLAPEVIGEDWVPEEAFMAARVKFTEGRIQQQQGKLEEAMTTMIDAVRSMGEQLMGTSPRNQNQAQELATAYTILAELVGQHFSAQDALDAHQQAVPILLELNRLHPDWGEVKYLLARNNGAIAQLERDMGQVAEATRKKQDAMELINEVLADFPEHPSYRFLQAKLRGDYAGFLADAKKYKEAETMVKPAIASLEVLIQKAEEQGIKAASPAFHEWRVQLAQCHGVLGHALQSSGQKAGAKTAFSAAATHWQTLATNGPPDEMVKRGLAWVQDRLQKLQ
jgi:eukaryotic-like serine/threonine-protein kinase